MNTIEPRIWIDHFKHLCDQTDPIARRYFEQGLGIHEQKSDESPVTLADLEIETCIRNFMQQTHPAVGILGEEFPPTQDQAPTRLVIDPIDGTRNFVAGIPFFATLLALETQGEVVAAMVSAPQTRERWWAIKNQGAFYNGVPIRVSSVSDLSKAQAFHGSLFGNEAQKTPPALLEVLSKTARQRGFGDYYPHMLVAMGCGELALDFGLKHWDVAPLKLIVEEAGGKATAPDGGSVYSAGAIVSTNGHLHDRVLGFFKP
ncbi:MAG: inositol monophosphatase [Candidatus Margulisiibacteriota bacterium]